MPETDEIFIRQLSEYKGDYSEVDKDRLVLFAVNILESKKIEPTFDKVVVAVFKTFPKKFSLIGFSEYPDAKTVYYCIYNHCTLSKKWLSGNVQSGFKITDRGKYFLEESQKILEGKIKTIKKYTVTPKRKEVTFINKLRETSAYRKFMQNKKDEITVLEISDSLMVSDKSIELIHARIKKYLEYAERIEESSVVNFLKFIEDKMEAIRCQKRKE